VAPTNTPTITPSPTLSPTVRPSKTPTQTYTLTPTFTYTPTPEIGMIDEVTRVEILAFPGGPEIGYLTRSQTFTVLYGKQIYDGWVWIEIQDDEGRVGWIPQYVSVVVTETPTLEP
jgi:hypothetical protein